MRRFSVPEKTFLKDFALRQFNYQFNEKIKSDACDIQSIPPEGDYKLGYEITHLCQGGTFRLRMFLNLGPNDNIAPFRLKVITPYIDGELGDEFFVTSGTVDSAHHDYDNYSFMPLKYEECNLAVINMTNGSPFSLVNGGGILLV